MDGSVIISIISGLVAIVTVIINTRAANREMTHRLETVQAVTDTKLDNLIAEVREHNNFARQMPVLEERVKTLEREIHELKAKTGGTP